jgi:very-short-patch-repair endonuclease
MSRYEEQLARMIALRGLPDPVRQFRFAEPHRQYRVDFAWPDRNLVVEVDGGAFVGRGGRGAIVSRTLPVAYHSTVEDYRKRNLLNQLGWRVLAFQPEQILRGEAVAEIELALGFGATLPPEGGVDQAWLEKLWRHVEGLAQIDRVRRRVREAKTAHRRSMQQINAEAKRTFPRGRR